MKYGIIYKHTNKINGKSYVGQTTRENVEKRFSKSDSTYRNYKTCPAFLPALEKYGWNNFETEILVTCFDQDSLNRMEEYYIKFYNSIAPNGYNTNAIIEGNVKLSELTKVKIGAKQKAYQDSLEIKPPAPNKKEHIFINGIELKQCPKCLENKKLELFVKNNLRWDGLATYCKKCHSKNKRDSYVPQQMSDKEWEESYQKRSEAQSEAQQKYYKKHPERRQHMSKISSIPIIATHIETGKTLEFASAKEANNFGFNNTNIGQAIKHNKPYKGYTWKKA